MASGGPLGLEKQEEPNGAMVILRLNLAQDGFNVGLKPAYDSYDRPCPLTPTLSGLPCHPPPESCLPLHAGLSPSHGVDAKLALNNYFPIFLSRPQIARRSIEIAPSFTPESSPPFVSGISLPTTMTGPQGTFTGVTGTDGPNTADISSFAASFASAFSATAGGSNTATQTSAQASATGTDSNDSTATSSSAPVTSPTTFSTSTTSTAYASSTLPPGVSGTASNAASSTTGAVTVSEKSSCSGLSCHPGLKAAIAVPVVVAALVALFLLFFCIRRRRRKSDGVISEKKPKTPGKGWSRHLRAFSFDAELLMGGRFSGTNSMRSRDPSVRSAGTNSHTGGASVEPSLHSIEEVAPPYRDAISHAQIPTTSIQADGGAPLAAGAAAAASVPDPIPRPASTATAPPPYRSIAHDVRSEPLTPVSGNPFADSAPVSPIEGSPFNDPPEEDGQRPVLSRNSSLSRSVNTEDGAPSDAGSIREAQVGRRVSVRTSGTPPRSTT